MRLPYILSFLPPRLSNLLIAFKTAINAMVTTIQPPSPRPSASATLTCSCVARFSTAHVSLWLLLSCTRGRWCNAQPFPSCLSCWRLLRLSPFALSDRGHHPRHSIGRGGSIGEVFKRGCDAVKVMLHDLHSILKRHSDSSVYDHETMLERASRIAFGVPFGQQSAHGSPL